MAGKEFFTLPEIDQVADAIRSRTQYRPRVGLILGSGLGDLANAVTKADVIPYEDLPYWPVSTVPGHAGRLVIGLLENQPVIVMQGRVHYYEGYSMQEITLPVRAMQRLGVELIIITNAAGAIHPDYLPGDVMLITDQINMIGMAGLSPLRGPNLDEMGERFPDMSQAYDRKLIEQVRAIAAHQDIHLREGVYACLAGPSFESPADLRFLRTIGADAVGMSTVPEVIVARHGKTRVVGFSGISNKANLDGSTTTSHEEVLQAGQLIVPKLKTLILGILRSLE
ncbi:purine nucleoside phosphorylase I, inosine and guanosine-specific [Longilinea arvoryzae]|uniref:Purine nucleoside phosphorylase n=1 Tax=Longilinea arvoryzae TaxID=360412 RepID=A0A0S7BN21_9CHLR|nr:purine-nucleoside phosphorylase [Longilinea arvoryzae]GAP15146.1 purine nucleoside phosphorylase I, inosine and guanosine-specific [Longilinea arvoryzae]